MGKNWKNQRVLIIGAARQGLAMARYLAQQGAQVVINDQRSAEQLLQARLRLENLPVEWIFDGHPLEALDGVDLLCISGGVPLNNPLVVAAFERGIPVTNDSQIFMEECPCRVIGITGSAGKTTTTTLVGRIAGVGTLAPQKVWVGGNIGLPLIDQVDQISVKDTVILELSSFQLELMTRSPQIGAILNITPNHLDRHGTMEAYAAAKARIILNQDSGGTAVLGREDPGAWALAGSVKGRLFSFGLKKPAAGLNGAFHRDGRLWLRDERREIELMPADKISLRGEHNLLNVLAACTIAYAAGYPVEAMQTGIERFCGVDHRLQFVRNWNGSSWYNDSIATAPERTMAAIQSFHEPLVLLLGGRDKNLPWASLAALVHQRVDHVIVFGDAAGKIMTALGPQHPGVRPYSLIHCEHLKDAVMAAAGLVEPGDVVLLSPGGTSFDEFVDFEERGRQFTEWVNQL